MVRNWRSRLRQDAYPPDSQVLTELPFAFKHSGNLFEGRVDRVILIRESGRLVGAEVLDFKTDRLPPGDEAVLKKAVRGYNGQMGIYCSAVASLYDLPEEKVHGTLVFLALGRTEASPS